MLDFLLGKLEKLEKSRKNRLQESETWNIDLIQLVVIQDKTREFKMNDYDVSRRVDLKEQRIKKGTKETDEMEEKIDEIKFLVDALTNYRKEKRQLKWKNVE